MAKLVIFGATGYAGSRIVAEAARRGHQVTAVARGLTNQELPVGVIAVAGSLYDEALLMRLAAGAAAVVSVIPSRSPDDGLTLVDALPSLVRVAQATGCRVGIIGGAGSLLVSEGGAEVRVHFASALPPAAMPGINTHADVLAALRQTPDDFDWFFLSPPLSFGAHVPGEHLGHYRVGADVMLTDEQGNAAIGGDDFADALVDEIESPQHHRRRFTVAY